MIDDPHHTGDADVAHEGQADLQGAPESQIPTPQRERGGYNPDNYVA